MNKGSVLVIDDEEHQRRILEEVIKSFGYKAQAIDSPSSLIQKIKAESHDIVVTDLQMPEMSGLELLQKIKQIDPTLSVIIVTAHGTIQSAVEAIKHGAEDYVSKPVEFGALELALERVFKKRELVKEREKLVAQVEVLKRDIGIKYHLTSAIGTSPDSAKLLKKIEEYSGNREPLVLFGERGVGKTDVARMIHYNSPLETNTLLQFDCGAIPEHLHETYLFGEERISEEVIGHPGLVEKAHMGTLIISKIHLLNRACQARLLTVMRKQQSQRVNGAHFYHVHVRVIATSNRSDFDKMPENGRRDLHDYLLGHFIHIPPLRERKEDIPLLVLANIRKLAPLYGKKLEKADKGLIESLATYDFPGNYKELETMIESAVIKSNNEATVLAEGSLPLHEVKKAASQA